MALGASIEAAIFGRFGDTDRRYKTQVRADDNESTPLVQSVLQRALLAMGSSAFGDVMAQSHCDVGVRAVQHLFHHI